MYSGENGDKMETTIKTIEEIFKSPYYSYGFEIPYYQRGYRWRDENIKDLIIDINEMSITKENEGYCLQPIVINLGRSSNLPQIVDGQQRLTTIALVRKELKCDDAQIFNSLRYTDRNSIDRCFLERAEDTIKKVLCENEIDPKKFREKLKKCLFIVCTINTEDKEAENVFLRLNVGKIPLSSAEIFKAYCLTEEDADCKDNDFIGIWNTVESALQDDSIYYFFSHDDNERNPRYYSTRMDFLLEVFALIYCTDISVDIIKIEYEKNPNFIFFRLKGWVDENGNTPGKFIQKLERLFAKFLQVYSDCRLNNLFGYLSCYPGHADILSLCKSVFCDNAESMSDCLNNLAKQSIEKIIGKNKIRDFIGDLVYGKNNNEIKQVLLLHNSLKSADYNSWFNYNVYRNSDYDLEHIHAKAELKTKKDVEKFLADINREFIGTIKHKENQKFFDAFNEFCEEFCANDTDISSQEIQERLEQFENCIWALQSGKDGSVMNDGHKWIPQISSDLKEEDADEWRLTSIMNLCLLQASINRSISNNGFAEKRKQVTYQINASGEELPIASALIFGLDDNDFYGTKEAGVWNKTMGKNHLNDIVDTITKGVFGYVY